MTDFCKRSLNQGIDQVSSFVSYTLGKNLEKLTLIGFDNISGTGNALNNEIIGNEGNNPLTGGLGMDTFYFYDPSDGIDTITDFVVAEDTIFVSVGYETYYESYGFGGGLTPDAPITPEQFVIGTAAADANDRFIYNDANGALFYDVDGLGGNGQVQFATLPTDLTMTNNDIFVIA